MIEIQEEKPIIIKESTYTLYGIIREAPNAEKMVILAPWVMGDRTGVGRMYVELARKMQENSITSICVDMPQINYSFDPQFSDDHYVECYAIYLEKVYQTMRDIYPETEIIILGFCSSAIPAIYVSRKHNLNKVITLNPYHFPLTMVKKPVHESFIDYIKYYSNTIDMLHIISEKEEDFLSKRDYIQKYFEDENCNVHVERIMGANHTFDGWLLKKEVHEKLLNWITN